MSVKKLLFITAAALVALPVYAQPFAGGHSSCGGREHSIERMTKHLGLSKAQVQAVRDIEDRYRPKLREVEDRMSDNHKALAALKGDDGKLRELADAGGKTMADMIVLRSQMRGEIDKVLTDAQREKMHEHQKGMMHGPDHHEH
jgi:Spy/CpxP family protein refolding chaperone